jgi:DNA-binding CsgD family transcriptional regulator
MAASQAVRKKIEETLDRTPTAAELVRQLIETAPPPEPHPGDGPPGLSQIVVDLCVDGVRFQLVRIGPKPQTVSISPREREIARLVAKGYPNKMIAGILEVSTWTVGTHLRRIFSKLQVGSRAAMVARLLEQGLLVEQDR